ncbi:ABC transporter ATP-binding protein [Brevibacterium casei]|uniref:ABC transporter ATP-binding protein n=1 Tax=Brevibacterium casei TaxID=33889 RepID=UPI00223AE559|nr:ABC transporter ATP-binding protein [Brevibacterium casei]MCT1559268.1 ABC transporter ATP-binding protein [Brevibacterium casei]
MAAIADVSLDVGRGESLVVLGPSGSGKSTLLRLIAGLEHPTEGTITVDGRDQAGLAPYERDIAIVFQHFALYPHLSARDNITLGLRHGLKVPRREAEQRAADIAEMLGIRALLDRPPKQMSGGQRQRVALARALARKSSTVLLDEPLSGLDAQLHLSLRLEIARRLREVGATSVMVTHDQADAMATADRIAVMRAGRLEQIGTPDEIYHRPASLFVAGFVGSPPMNLVEGVATSDGIASVLGTHRLALDADEIVFGLRPEDITPDSGSGWKFSGQVVEVEHEGSSRILDVSIGGTVLRVRVPVRLRYERGERVALRCDPARVAVFDAATGKNLGVAAELLSPAAWVGP